MTRISRLIPAALLALAALSGEAFAHAHLKAAKPADGSTLKAAPAEIDATFSESIDLGFSGLVVKAEDGAAIETGAATLMDGKRTLMVPLSAPLKPGRYTVEWHALSSDGHKSKGAFSFTVRP